MKKAVFIVALAIAAVCTSCNDDRPLREFKIRFESNSDSSVADQTVKEGEKLIKPQDPTREGYIFAGWFKEASFDTEWEFDTDVVTSSMWLYAKWRAKLLKSVTDAYGAMKYEYDSQNRLTKLTYFRNEDPANPAETNELTYNAEGDLLKREYKSVNPIIEFTHEYAKSGNTITITRKDIGLPDYVFANLYLNNNGYPAKLEEYRNDFIGGSTYILTFSYKDGNLSKTSYTRFHHTEGITVFLNDYEYVFDNMKSHFYSVQTPKWFMIMYFGTGGSQNNRINESYFVYESETTRRLERSIDYVFEYDSDGFPSKRTYTGVDGKTEYVSLLEYE